MKKIMIICLILVSIIMLSGCKNNIKKNIIKDSQTLVRTVYDATTSQKNEVNNKLKPYKLTNNFSYKEFRVYESFGFTATLDFTMQPYLENYIIGEELFVIIALLEFTNSTFEKSTYLQKMIIFQYQNEICGFMSTNTSLLTPGRGYEGYNNPYKGEQNRKINYIFASGIFLTKNEIVKYYERGDVLYGFNYSEDFSGNISFISDVGIAFEERTEYEIEIKKDSFVELNKDIVIDLVNLAIVEKVEFIATIKGISEDDWKIYVESEEYPSLKSVTCRFAIITPAGFISVKDLKVGDEIILYIYLRHSEYKPVDITVDNIYIN